jgi:Ferritin-like domain
MATQETQILDEIIVRSRRKMLSLGTSALAGLAVAGLTKAAVAQSTITDTDILNFALQLEYLEANFYNLAVNGVTIDKLSTPVAITGTGSQGVVVTKPNFTKTPFASTTIAAYAAETAVEETKHVTFLRSALTTAAVAQPQIDLVNSFNTLAQGALGLPAFDPFGANGTLLTADQAFLIGAFIFEDVGVTAYSGAAGSISTNSTLVAAAGILAVEAYHAGLVRTAINAADAGTDALNSITRKIAAFRNKLDGVTTVDDYGISQTTAPAMVALQGTNATYPAQTIVDASPTTSLAFSRTPTQILQVVTGVTTSPHKGVFFPNGLNGNIV